MKSLIFLLLWTSPLWAQNPFTVFLSPDCHVGLEAERNTEILPAKYATIQTISIGNDWLISAKDTKGDSYFLYQNGKKIDLPYPKVFKVNEQLLGVGQSGQYGLVNTRGKGIALIQYQAIKAAGTSFVITKIKNKYGVLDVDGKSILANQFEALVYWDIDLFFGQQNGAWQLYDKSGKKVNKTAYTAIAVFDNNLPLAAAQKEGKWAIIDAKGLAQTDFVFDGINILPNGWIAVQDKEKKWQFLNEEFKPIAQKKYTNVQFVSNQAILVEDKGKWGALDAKYQLSIAIEYNHIVDLGQGFLGANNATNLYQIYNSQKVDWLEGETFTSLRFWAKDALGFWCKKEGFWQLFSYQEGKLTATKVKHIKILSEAYTRIENEEKKQGILNKKGEQIIPNAYDVLTNYQHFFKVKKGTKDWYYIDNKNRKLACQFLSR